MSVRYVEFNGTRGMVRGVRDGKVFILWDDDTADWINEGDVTFI